MGDIAGWVWIDYALLAVVAISAVVSLFRGFFREAMSLASWIVALWLAWQLGPIIAAVFTPAIDDPVLRMWVARACLFIGVLLLGGVVSKLVMLVMNSTGLTGPDRLLGMIFGCCRGVVLAGLLLVVLEALGFSESAWWQQSKLIPYAAPVVDIIRNAALDGVDYVGGVVVP